MPTWAAAGPRIRYALVLEVVGLGEQLVDEPLIELEGGDRQPGGGAVDPVRDRHRGHGYGATELMSPLALNLPSALAGSVVSATSAGRPAASLTASGSGDLGCSRIVSPCDPRHSLATQGPWPGQSSASPRRRTAECLNGQTARGRRELQRYHDPRQPGAARARSAERRAGRWPNRRCRRCGPRTWAGRRTLRRPARARPPASRVLLVAAEELVLRVGEDLDVEPGRCRWRR